MLLEKRRQGNQDKIVKFFSPLYLASIVVKEGVNQNGEIVKKYGELERSLDFNISKSVEVPFAELQ